MKYFCISEQTTNYLQKYIVLRKRKLFVGERTAAVDVITTKSFVSVLRYPQRRLPVFMRANNLKFSEAVIYHTVASDLSDLSDVKYDCCLSVRRASALSSSIFLIFVQETHGCFRIPRPKLLLVD
jgi:uroporphyrinogen-III synthase